MQPFKKFIFGVGLFLASEFAFSEDASDFAGYEEEIDLSGYANINDFTLGLDLH